LPGREAGSPNHLDNKVDSDQYVVNKELFFFQGLYRGGRRARETLVRRDGYVLAMPPLRRLLARGAQDLVRPSNQL